MKQHLLALWSPTTGEIPFVVLQRGNPLDGASYSVATRRGVVIEVFTLESDVIRWGKRQGLQPVTQGA